MKRVRSSVSRFALAAGLAALAALATGPARANDSSAALDTGGLALVYNAKIQMKAEDLFLSRSRIRVRYLFENSTKDDVETLVAFPLPHIDTGEGGNYSIDSNDPINFIDFKVSVDGQPVVPKVEARASALGVDITALLQRHHLPLTTILPRDGDTRGKFYDGLRTMPEEALTELEKWGAIGRTRDDAGKTVDVNPMWTANITFYWFQKFPAGRTIEVTHEYRPVPRDFFTSPDEIAAPEMRARYCPDADFLTTATRMAKQGSLSGVALRYIVMTANNWWGPIGRFTLTVDKEDPKFVLSTCLKGLEKTGPTTFSLTKDDFTPEADIGLLFLQTIKVE